MKNWFKKWIPTKQSVNNKHELKFLKTYFQSPTLWKFDRESVARGVAAGLAGAVIPGLQLLYAAALVILFRGNLPIALFATLITNPITAIPIVYFICRVGSFILRNSDKACSVTKFDWNFSSFHAFWIHFITWISSFGKSFSLGVLVVSISLAVLGYFGTILIWKISVLLFRKKK